MCDTLTPVPLVLSPKFQLYAAMPWSSLDAPALKLQPRSVQLPLKAATGGLSVGVPPPPPMLPTYSSLFGDAP